MQKGQRYCSLHHCSKARSGTNLVGLDNLLLHSPKESGGTRNCNFLEFYLFLMPPHRFGQWSEPGSILTWLWLDLMFYRLLDSINISLPYFNNHIHPIWRSQNVGQCSRTRSCLFFNLLFWFLPCKLIKSLLQKRLILSISIVIYGVSYFILYCKYLLIDPYDY